MPDSLTDTQCCLAEEPGRSSGSISTTSTRLNHGNDNIPQKRSYTSILDMESSPWCSDNSRNVDSHNNNNSSLDETGAILATEESNSPSPFTYSTDAFSYQSSQDGGRDYLILSYSDIDGDDEADNSTELFNLPKRLSNGSLQPQYESVQDNSSFGDSIRISQLEDSDTDNTELPTWFDDTQQLEHDNPPHQPTSTSALDDVYDNSAIWDDFPDLTDMILAGEFDTAPYDDGKNNAIVRDDLDKSGGSLANEDDSSQATVSYDVGEPPEALVDDDANSVDTIPYDVAGPDGFMDGDDQSSATIPYDVASEEPVMECEYGLTVAYNGDSDDGLEMNNTSDTSDIYDMGGFEDLNDLENDGVSNESSFTGNYSIFDSQPDSNSTMGDGYDLIGYNNGIDCMTNSRESTRRAHTTSESSSQLPPKSPQSNSVASALVYHDNNNASHQQHDDLEQEQNDAPMSMISPTMGLESIGKGTKSDTSNPSPRKSSQQTSIEAFCVHLSLASSLSTAKSFSDSDDLPAKDAHSDPPSSSQRLAPKSLEPELVVSCSPPHKNSVSASLDQLRMAKIKKRSILSPTKDQQWLQVSQNLAFSPSPPDLRKSHSLLSDTTTQEQSPSQNDNNIANEPDISSTPPTPTERPRCRPKRGLNIGLSKPKNASSTPSIASMLGREHPKHHHNTLELTDTITKSIPPPKKTLGMTRRRTPICK